MGQAQLVLERVRIQFTAQPVELSGKAVPITFSVGLTDLANTPYALDNVLERADQPNTRLREKAVIASASKLRLFFLKALANFRRDLAIGHLINGFNPNDAPTKIFIPKTFFEFTFRLAWAKYLN